jgi:DNA-binding NarL/FixJ family response regulator
VTARILIVEDDDAIATGLALNLKLADRASSIARDGVDALRQAEAEDFALILLDINLPRKTGLEVLTEIGAGLSNAEIADKLRISGATVKSHINHLLAKTGARDRGQLVGYAFRHGLAA